VEGLTMTEIAIALQQRLLAAARRELGPDGDAILEAVCRRTLGIGIEHVSYTQLPELIAAVEREGPGRAGAASAAAIAVELDRFRIHADADLGERLVRVMAERLGPAAEPCLTHICGKLGLALSALDRTQLPLIAAVIEKDGAALLGPMLARSVAGAVDETRRMRPHGMAVLLNEIAAEQGGEFGAQALQDICRARLGVDLETVDIEGLAALARAVEQDAPVRLGEARTAAFISAFRHAVVDPGEQLRARLLELANTHLGPAAPVLLKRVCTRNGVPFDVVSYEHLMWLADTFRAEVAPIAGEQEAEEFAREVRALLPDAAPASEPAPAADHLKETNVLRGVRDVARGWLRAQP
jgi:hypothetical protein